MACHSEPYKWRIWNLCLEFYKWRRNPGLALAVMAEDEALPPQPAAAPTQTSPDCLPSPPPSFCFPSRHPRLPTAVFPVSRAPAPTPAGWGRPTTRGVRTPPRRKWWRPREEEERPLVRREGERLVSVRRPLPRLSLPLSPARRAWTRCPADAPPARAGRGSRRRQPTPPVRSPRLCSPRAPPLWNGGCSPGPGFPEAAETPQNTRAFPGKLRLVARGHGRYRAPSTKQGQPEQAVDRALRAIPEHTGNFFQVFRLVQTWSREELAQWLLSGFGLAGVAGKGSLPNACFQCVFRALTAQVCDSGTSNGFRTTKEQKECCVKILQSLRLNLREHQQTKQKHVLTKESWVNRDKWNSKHTASWPQNNV